jgi:acetylornithine/succinyldiaminopimelate/putrescine aminotransferase
MDNNVNANDVFSDLNRYCNPAQMGAMKTRGHNIIEDKREGAFLFDCNGTKYIDCTSSSSIYNLGRRQPELAAELKKAMYETDQGNFPLISSEKALLAKKIAGFVGGSLACSMFSVVRGESMDFACKLARGYTGRKELCAVSGSWFGHTGFSMSLAERKDKNDFGTLMPECVTIPFGDLDAAEKIISTQTAAVMLEPLQVENHCRAATDEYLRGLKQLCTKRGALLVFDETQSGLGRCGKKFFYEYSGVEPDVLIIGEALGGGMFPIAATVFTAKASKFMNAHPLIHLSTFGGSDLGCRVGIKALEIYERTRLWENAAAMGATLLDGIRNLQKKYPGKIISVNGCGLAISIDTGSADNATELCKKAAAAGIIVAVGEVADATVIIRPALIIDQNNVTEILKAIAAAVQ